MKHSGIFIVRFLNDVPMPVIRNSSCPDQVAKVDRSNIFIGKTEDFDRRNRDFRRDFGCGNVEFEPLVNLKIRDLQPAITRILQELGRYRKISPKGGKLQWLEGVSCTEVQRIACSVLKTEGIEYTIRGKNNS